MIIANENRLFITRTHFELHIAFTKNRKKIMKSKILAAVTVAIKIN